MVDQFNDNLEEEKCCGSGCNNCVLDKKITAVTANFSSKSNILRNNDFKYDNIDCSLVDLRMPAGYHIMIRAPVEDNDSLNKHRHDQMTEGNFISRPYTPICINEINCEFEILVKIEKNGLMSNYLSRCSVGDVVDVKGPYGTFDWTPNTIRNLICISQGVAIAPLYAVAQSILQNENDETFIDFFSCFRSINDILLRDEIYDMQQYWNFQSKVYLSNETACCCEDKKIPNCPCIKSKLKYNEVVCAYRLDEIELSKMFIKKRLEDCWTLICGTNRFINFIKMSLKKLDVKDKNIIVFD